MVTEKMARVIKHTVGAVKVEVDYNAGKEGCYAIYATSGGWTACSLVEPWEIDKQVSAAGLYDLFKFRLADAQWVADDANEEDPDGLL